MLAASGQENFLISIQCRATLFMILATRPLSMQQVPPLDSLSPGKPHLWELLPNFPDPLTLLPNDGPVEFLLND